jgi:DNA replication protein DnaC
VLTSNRTPDEWLAVMTDPLLAQAAVDRLTSTAHELVIEGQSYRRRQKPSVDR